ALSPERVSCDRCTSRQGMWRETPYKGASRPIFRTLKSQSALSSWHSCPAPPVDTPAGRDCLAARTAQFRPWLPPQASSALYWGPPPSLQHSKPVGDNPHAPPPRPAAGALPALAISFVFWVTWLSGVPPRTAGRMSGLPPRHSFGKAVHGPALPFQGAEYRSSSLTPRPGPFAVTTGRIGPSGTLPASPPRTLHGQPLRGLARWRFPVPAVR